MRNTTIATALVLAALVAAPTVTFAQGGPGGPGACGNEPLGMGMGPGHGHGRGGPGGHRGPGFGLLSGQMAERLGLSDEQTAQIEAIMESARLQGEPLRAQLESARAAFRQSCTPGSFDEAAARAFAESQSAARTELKVLRMRAHNEAFNVLTPEQQERAREIRELLDDLGGPRRGGGKRSGGRR